MSSPTYPPSVDSDETIAQWLDRMKAYWWSQPEYQIDKEKDD